MTGGVVVAREQSWNVRTKVVGERRRTERKRASNRERVHGSAGLDEPVTRPDRDAARPERPLRAGRDVDALLSVRGPRAGRAASHGRGEVEVVRGIPGVPEELGIADTEQIRPIR